MALLTPAQTAAEIKRKAAAGIPLTNTSNAANNAAYKAATTTKPPAGGVTVPNMSLVNTTPSPNSGVTVPNYTAPSSTPLNGAPTVTMPSANPAVKPVTIPRTEQTLNTQAGLVNTPWKYNSEEDQSLQAAIRDADNKLLVNQKNTNAFLRSNGQGKSSYSETVANQLANQSAENIANTLVPQYEALAYQKNQDQIGNLRNLYSDQYQQDVTRPLSEADRTGVYQDAQTRDDLFQIMMYKAEAEAPGTTPERRAELNALANQKRASLDSRGIDSSQVGANVNSKNINTSGIGIRTLAGQAQDQSVKNANLDAATAVSNMTGKVITPQTDWQGLIRQAANPNTPLNANQQNTQFNQNLQNRQQDFNESQQNWNNQFDMAKFEEDTRRYGLDYALQQQQNQISAMNANTSRAGNNASIANNQFGQLMDVWQANGTAPAGLEGFGIQAGTPYSTGAAAKAQQAVTAESYATSYIDKSVNRDADGNITNLDSVKAQILQSGLPDSEIAKLYSRYGIPLPAGYSGN